MANAIGGFIFLFILYLIYRDVEERHIKSLNENSKLLYKSQKELHDFKEYYYKLKEERRNLEIELENTKRLLKQNQHINNSTSKNTDTPTFPTDDLIAF